MLHMVASSAMIPGWISYRLFANQLRVPFIARGSRGQDGLLVQYPAEWVLARDIETGRTLQSTEAESAWATMLRTTFAIFILVQLIALSANGLNGALATKTVEAEPKGGGDQCSFPTSTVANLAHTWKRTRSATKILA